MAEIAALKHVPSFFISCLVQSFVFFLDADNLLTFLLIIFVNASAMSLASMGIRLQTTIGVPISMGYLYLVALLVQLLVFGYLCAFYLATIVETASGEDALPSLWLTDAVSDLLLPGLRFIGSWLWVLLPALAVMAKATIQGDPVPWPAVRVAAVAGLFFWPVVVLGVAIGGSFRGLWPHLVVRTALSAPVPYLAVCLTLLVAAGLTFLPRVEPFCSWLALLQTRAVLAVGLLNSALGAYAMILAMRVIGLFYRHYKGRFPWVAE